MKRRRHPFVFVVPIFVTLLVLSGIKSIECSANKLIFDYNFDQDLMPSDFFMTNGFVSNETNIKAKLNIDLNDDTSISINLISGLFFKIVFFVIKIVNLTDNNRPGRFLVFKSSNGAVIFRKKMSLFKSEEYVLQFEYFSNEQRCRKDTLKLVIQLVHDAEEAVSERVVFDSTAMRGQADVLMPEMWEEMAACFRVDANEDYKVSQVRDIQSLSSFE